MNVYVKFGEILSFFLQMLSGNGIMTDRMTDGQTE